MMECVLVELRGCDEFEIWCGLIWKMLWPCDSLSRVLLGRETCLGYVIHFVYGVK